jgi:non-ribosomal peptide synthetase component E (peptide arylation enzyme)
MVYASPYPSLPLPKDAAIWNNLEQQARDKPHAPAFVCGITDRVLTFRQVLQQAQFICAGLHANGVRKGDVRVLRAADEAIAFGVTDLDGTT